MSPIRMSKVEEAVRTVLAFHNAFNRHDVEGMMRLMSKHCIFENTYPPPDGTVYSGKTYSGKTEVTQFWRTFFQQSPRAQIEIEEIFGAGERCVMRWRYTWIDAAGQSGHVRSVDLYRVKGGLICEKLSYVKG